MSEALGTEKKACVQSMAIAETRGEKIFNCLTMGYLLVKPRYGFYSIAVLVQA